MFVVKSTTRILHQIELSRRDVLALLNHAGMIQVPADAELSVCIIGDEYQIVVRWEEKSHD